jgi:hypothetical protein
MIPRSGLTTVDNIKRLTSKIIVNNKINILVTHYINKKIYLNALIKSEI